MSPCQVDDARFLHREIIQNLPEAVVEIGIASGVSSAVILNALALLNRLDLIDFGQLSSFDLRSQCYFDETKPIGFAVKEMIPDEAHRQSLHTGCTSRKLCEYHENASIEFLFLDASHQHPWPCLDLLTVLPWLKNGATICFHDINLPIHYPRFHNQWGVHWLFSAIKSENSRISDCLKPNVGAITFYRDQADSLREKALEVVHSHDWECTLDNSVDLVAPEIFELIGKRTA
ncbi:MAG: class I SAM-dependent methyltransferase [Cyanothece sp. SIO1E1]|nr:class I SAM-dependent methyltransferase [Cyanothece sp. SIO1E1]